MEKKWYESRTIWFNLFMGIGGVVIAVMPKSAPVLTEAVFGVVWSLVAIFLRKDTVAKIE